MGSLERVPPRLLRRRRALTMLALQALSEGAIPIYSGAPNVEKYLPQPYAAIKASDFPSVDALAKTQPVSAVPENDLRLAGSSLDVFSEQTSTELKSKLTGVA